MSREQLDELVTAYYGRRARGTRSPALGCRASSAMHGWTLWGCIQNGSSPLDFDFWELGAWSATRCAVAEFRGPDFARLLDDVQASD